MLDQSHRPGQWRGRRPAGRPVAWPTAPGALPAQIPRIRAAMTLIPPTSTGAPVHDSLRRSPDANRGFVTDRDSSTVARHAISVRSVRLWRGAFGLLRQCIKVDLRAPAGRRKDGPVGQDRVVAGPDRGGGPARRGSNEPGCHLPQPGHAGTLAWWQAGGWRQLHRAGGHLAAVRGWAPEGWMGGLADGAGVRRGRAGDAGWHPAGAVPRAGPGRLGCHRPGGAVVGGGVAASGGGASGGRWP